MVCKIMAGHSTLCCLILNAGKPYCAFSFLIHLFSFPRHLFFFVIQIICILYLVCITSHTHQFSSSVAVAFLIQIFIYDKCLHIVSNLVELVLLRCPKLVKYYRNQNPSDFRVPFPQTSGKDQ